MGSKTTYYCDSCKQKVDRLHNVEVNRMGWITQKPYYNFELCTECLNRFIITFDLQGKLE